MKKLTIILFYLMICTGCSSRAYNLKLLECSFTCEPYYIAEYFDFRKLSNGKES